MAPAHIQAPDFLRNRQKTHFVPHGGWAIDAQIALEEESGDRLISRLATASDQRRSVVYCALGAALADRTAQTALAELTPGEQIGWLLGASPDDILSVVLGEGISGIAGLIAKTNGTPLARPEHYLVLAKIAAGTCSRHRKQASCLRHLPAITSDVIDVVTSLRTRLIRPAIVSTLSPASAKHLELLAKHLERVAPTFGDDVMAQSLEQRGGVADLFRWASRAVLRHGRDLCDPSLADDAEWVFLRSAADFRSTADRFRVCIADETRGAALASSLGLVGYALWQNGAIIAEIRRMTDGAGTVWVCERLHAPQNGKVEPCVEAEARRSLRERNVLSLAYTCPDYVPRELVDRYGDVDTFVSFAFRAAETLEQAVAELGY